MYTKLIAAAVALATTDTVATLNVEDSRTLGIQVHNTGGNALDAFEIWGRVSPHAPLVQLCGVPADYTTPAYPVLKASASPVSLAATASAWMFLNVEGLSEIQVKASSTVGPTTLDIHACRKFSV